MSKDKKSVEEKIASALDINLHGTEEKTDIIKVEEPTENDDKSSDYELVRGNLKDIIKTGQGAVEGILNVASEGESPRAYEVVSQLLKTVVDANKDLIDLHKQMKDLEDDETKNAKSITNNAIYVGSTKDLQKLVKDSRHQADAIDADFNILEEAKDGKSTE
jgi:hypothetical protein